MKKLSVLGGRISGVSGNCDFDACNGTFPELKFWQGV